MSGSYHILTGEVAPVVASRSARGRRAFLYVILLLYGYVIAGFWPYWTGGAVQQHRTWIVHLHAFIYLGWMALVLAQVVLIVRRRADLHKRLGKVGMFYGIFVLLAGITVALIAPTVHVIRGESGMDEMASFLIIPLGDMVLFGSLFWVAIANRHDSDIHRPAMLMATVALMFAPVGRFAAKGGPLLILALWLLPVVVAAVGDWRRRPKARPTWIIGTCWMLLMFCRVFAMHTTFWLQKGRSIITSLEPSLDRLF